MPRAFSSAALSIWSYAVKVAPPVSARTLVIAAVNDVLPWSTWPIVPMLQWGLLRANFSLAIAGLLLVALHSQEAGCRSLEFLDDLGGDTRRDLFVVVELHGEVGPALRAGPQLVDIAEHVGQRHHRIDDHRIGPHVLPLHLAATGQKITHHEAGVLLGGNDLDLHDRLEQNRTALLQALAERRAGGDFEGERRGVDVVIGTVDQCCLDIDNGEAGKHARSHDAIDAFFDTGNVFLRHRAADDLGFERRSRARFRRLEHQHDLGELTRAARLLLVGIVDLGLLRQPLAIGDLRRADARIDLVGAPEDIDFDIEVKFAHSLQNGLAGFLIGGDAEGRVLSGELRQRDAELLLVGLRLRLDRDLDDRLWKFHLFEDDRLLHVAERVARTGILEPSKRDDVASVSLFDVLAVVGVHEEHAADTLALVLRRIENRRARLDLAGIDAAEGDCADEGVVHDLEAEHREGLVIVRHAEDFVARIDIVALDATAIHGGRQIVDDRVEQGLYALVLEGRTAKDRHERNLLHRLTDAAFQGLNVRLLPIEIGAHDIVIHLDRSFDQDMTVLVGLCLEVGRNLFVVVFGAKPLVLPDDRLHAQKVDDALEVRLGTDRKLDTDRTAADLGVDLFDATGKVSADLVHLIDEHDARHVVFVGLTPDGLRLRLNALVAVEHAYSAVEHAQATLDFDGEVDVAGRVDDVEAFVLPEGRGRGRRDGDAALLLLLHPVHGRSAVVHFADLMRLAGIIEDALSGRRLPSIDVGHDAEVTIVLDSVAARHDP